MSILKAKWQCDRCDLIYDREDDAIECCQPDVSMVYVCPICAEYYDRECEAIECCGFDHDATPPSTAELEKAGQMRLLP